MFVVQLSKVEILNCDSTNISFEWSVIRPVSRRTALDIDWCDLIVRTLWSTRGSEQCLGRTVGKILEELCRLVRTSRFRNVRPPLSSSLALFSLLYLINPRVETNSDPPPFYSRAGNFKAAHEVYVKGCSAKGLDYPDYLLEMWLAFEHQNGTLSDLEFTITKVKRQRRGLEAKRIRVRLRFLFALCVSIRERFVRWMRAGVDLIVQEAKAAGQAVSAPAAAVQSDSMDVDNFLDTIVEEGTAASKRAREDESTGPTAKKSRVDSAAVVAPVVPEEKKRFVFRR